MLPFHRDWMCNFFQEGIQFLKIQQIIWIGMHFVIHLRILLSKREKIVQTNQTEVCFSLFFSSGSNLFFEFQYVSKISTKHLVILCVVQAKFEGGLLKNKRYENTRSRQAETDFEAYSH